MFITQERPRGECRDLSSSSTRTSSRTAPSTHSSRSRAEYKKVPQWVKEGGADWLGGMTVQETGSPVEEVDWEPWLEEPTDDLFTRSYSGVGFFAMIQQAGVDGWARMRDTLFAASGGNSAAYQRATAGLPDVFYKRWGPGLLRDKSLGSEWDYEGPGIDPSTPEHDCPRKRLERAAHDRPAGLGRRQDSISTTDILIDQVRQGRQGQPANPRRYPPAGQGRLLRSARGLQVRAPGPSSSCRRWGPRRPSGSTTRSRRGP